MNHLLSTDISIGNAALFRISSLIHTPNGGYGLVERTSLILGCIQLEDVNDVEVAGVTSSALLIAAQKFSEMAKEEVVTRKEYILPLGSNFDNYCVKVHQNGLFTLSFDVFDNYGNESILSDHQVPLEYFALLCECYSYFVQKIKLLHATH
ncbi:hypothetical protein [Hymenobacter arizonensis]|uniref:Uncharacterized protein n=1 Tax=Hymenobacter arizonensis TaxID=1227077 RepID=A0A1I6AG73_HYMAR|nr:hypothetical protein [Hymenobacter arizonensis]SFQ67670.1 hypothetical protein SAMN04515668_3647 [Hymenobacter arizonensis]